MALIKCAECGKEFSDKANACPNCACPVERKKENIKEFEEKEILSIKLDINKMRKVRTMLVVFAILCFVVGILIPMFMFFWVFSLMFLPIWYLYKKMEDNKLILTNKRLKGSLNMFFSNTSINIPLERLDNIVVNKDVFSTGIIIMSNNIKKGVGFVLNADEFVDTTMKEIEKYKNR